MNADGLWSTSGNWAGGVADGADSIAVFDLADTEDDRTVNLDTPRTIGGLVFGNTTPSGAENWILSNNGAAANILMLAVSRGTPTITVNTRDISKTATIGVVIAGGGGLTKEGVGILVLSGANSFAGGLGINAGEVRLSAGNDSGLGAPGGAVSLGNGAILRSSHDTTHTLGTGRALTVDIGGGTLAASGFSPRTFAFDIEGSGLLSLVAGSTQINLTGRNQAHTGGLEIATGRVQFSYATALPSTGRMMIAPGGGLIASGAFPSVNDWLASGRIDTGSLGALLLSRSSSETVNMTGYPALMLGASTDNAQFTGTLIPLGNVYRLGGGGLNGNNPRLVIAGANSLTGTRSLVVGSGVAGTTAVGISEAQDYTGGTTVTQGARLVVRHSQALGSGAVNNVNGEVLLSGGVNVANALTLTSSIDSVNTEESLRSNVGDNTWSGDVTLLTRSRFYANNTAGNKLTVSGSVNNGANPLLVVTGGALGGDIVISGKISGAGGLFKNNTAGTLTLAGANTYTGSTLINAGTLLVEGSLSVSSTVTVNRGGCLGGRGTAGAVTFNAGAALALDIADVTQAGDGLTITRLTGAGLDGFTLHLTGAATGFAGTGNYTWKVLTSSSVDRITLSEITLDTKGFGPAFTGGFTLSKDAHSLLVKYVGAPAPDRSGLR